MVDLGESDDDTSRQMIYEGGKTKKPTDIVS